MDEELFQGERRQTHDVRVQVSKADVVEICFTWDMLLNQKQTGSWHVSVSQDQIIINAWICPEPADPRLYPFIFAIWKNGWVWSPWREEWSSGGTCLSTCRATATWSQAQYLRRGATSSTVHAAPGLRTSLYLREQQRSKLNHRLEMLPPPPHSENNYTNTVDMFMTLLWILCHYRDNQMISKFTGSDVMTLALLFCLKRTF